MLAWLKMLLLPANHGWHVAETHHLAVYSFRPNSPAAQAVMTADDALTASAALSIFGISNSTVRSRGGTRVPSRARTMGESPPRAFSTALAPRASPWPSINASTARVTRFRALLGRPFGFPLCPGLNGRPRCFSLEFSANSETVAAAVASSLAGAAGSAEVRAAAAASAGTSGRCFGTRACEIPGGKT
jgi:hypothetical protein